MLQVQNDPNLKENAAFSHKDMETIVNVLANQPLQNLNAAAGLQALINRFVAFSAKHLGPTPKPKADAEKKGK
jgi:hypothetical protein